jgi:FKBP-type peptidyl-prolyl cis-trans isomerase 2
LYKKKVMTKINESSTVTVNYTGKLEDGSIFDSSMTEGREPLVATLGQGQLIRGFEQGLLEMQVGDKKTVEIDPIDAYGDVNEGMVQEVPKDRVPQEVEVGHVLQAETPMGVVNFNVLEVKDETVVLDANHPLAGKKLIFDLEVVGIN